MFFKQATHLEIKCLQQKAQEEEERFWEVHTWLFVVKSVSLELNAVCNIVIYKQNRDLGALVVSGKGLITHDYNVNG